MKRLLAFVVAGLTGGAVLTASPATATTAGSSTPAPTGFVVGQTACPS
jgi:hypothetical protein